MSKRNRTSDRDFAAALKNAVENELTLQDVAEELGLGVQSVYQRYNKWRKAGVPVPQIPMNPPAERKRGLDVEELSSMFK